MIAKAFKAYRFKKMMELRIKNKPQIKRTEREMAAVIMSSIELADAVIQKLELPNGEPIE